jgi:WD40 repeat protein
MYKPLRKYLIVFGTVILTLSSCQGEITPVPTPTETNTPIPIVSITKTPTLNAVENIMEAIRTQAASITEEPPKLQVDNIPLIPIKKRLGKGIVYAVAISPDGKTIAVAGDLSVSTYNFNSLQEIWSSPVEQIEIVTQPPMPWGQGDVVWSSDGSQLATLSGIGVSVWDAKTGELLHTFKERPNYINSIAWTQDGRLVAFSFILDNGQIVFWNVQTGEELFNRKGATSYAWIPQGNLLALELDNKEIIIWDIRTNKQLYSPLEVCDSYCPGQMVWSPDETRLATTGILDTVIVWDVQTGKQLLMDKIMGNHQALAMAWSPSNNYLAVAFNNGDIVVWDAQTGRQLHTFKGGNRMLDLDWSPDGKNLISLSQYESVVVWDIRTGEQLRSLDEHTSSVSGLVWSPSGDMLASGSEDGEVIIWESSSGKKLRSFHDSTGSIRSLAWSPNGKQLASGGHKITIWEAQTGNQIQVLTTSTEEMFTVVWSPDGSKLASISYDGQGNVWDVSTGECVLKLEKNRFSHGIAWSPQGNLLGTSYPNPPGGGREQVTLWNPQTGEAVRTQPGVYDLAWSPLGNIIASVSDSRTPNTHDDKTLILWDPKTGNMIRSIALGMFLNHIDWSPDGKYLVVAQDQEGALIVLNAQTGEKIYRLKGHAGTVTNVAWSPHGDLIASASEDGTVIIWEIDAR